MDKRCGCGNIMMLGLKTVVFARKVRIRNVPVHHCAGCGRNEVFAGVKREIGRLIGELGARPESGEIAFDRMNEWAELLCAALRPGRPADAAEIAGAVEERINRLLDLWLVASSLGDESWKSELQTRLSRLRMSYIT